MVPMVILQILRLFSRTNAALQKTLLQIKYRILVVLPVVNEVMTENIDRLSPEELGKLFPVTISEYNRQWRKRFNTEKRLIQKGIGTSNILRIEHIGSTAIPGLSAKPTIDIIVEISDSTDLSLLINDFKAIDYHFIPRPENPAPHMMFVKGYSLKGYFGQQYHVHIRYKGECDEIIFRDFLISHPFEAQKYAELKSKLASEFINDRERYTQGKTEFICRIMNTAKNILNTK